MNLIPAVALGLAGLACLFAAWRRRLPARWASVPLGWGLLLASGWLWAAGAGIEFGITLALLATPVIALGFVAANHSMRPRRAAEGPPKPNAEARSWLRHGLLFLLAVPVAAVASALIAVAVSLALPIAVVDAMVVVIVVMPVLWGCAAYWVCAADTRLLRPALTLLVGALAGAAVVYA